MLGYTGTVSYCFCSFSVVIPLISNLIVKSKKLIDVDVEGLSHSQVKWPKVVIMFLEGRVGSF